MLGYPGGLGAAIYGIMIGWWLRANYGYGGDTFQEAGGGEAI